MNHAASPPRRPRGLRATLALFVVSSLLLLGELVTAHEEAPVDDLGTSPDVAPPPAVRRDPDPRWPSAAVEAENACRNGTADATDYVPCLARRVDAGVNDLSDIPAVLCTIASLVDDNHVPVSYPPGMPRCSA